MVDFSAFQGGERDRRRHGAARDPRSPDRLRRRRGAARLAHAGTAQSRAVQRRRAPADAPAWVGGAYARCRRNALAASWTCPRSCASSGSSKSARRTTRRTHGESTKAVETEVVGSAGLSSSGSAAPKPKAARPRAAIAPSLIDADRTSRPARPRGAKAARPRSKPRDQGRRPGLVARGLPPAASSATSRSSRSCRCSARIALLLLAHRRRC